MARSAWLQASMWPLARCQPTLGPTRDVKDFALNVFHTVASQPLAKWVFVVDNLTMHVSRRLVRIVAKHDGLDSDLGVKGVRGILNNVESRRAFLVDTTHRIASSTRRSAARG